MSLQDERVVGMAALLRWQHPTLGSVSPAEFIPVAEESGLILPMGEWVLRTATRQLRRWMAAGLPVDLMAVNRSTGRRCSSARPICPIWCRRCWPRRFGTGYSSLSVLKRFHVYKLKIDQSFVRNLTEDPDDKAIVVAVMALAQSGL